MQKGSWGVALFLVLILSMTAFAQLPEGFTSKQQYYDEVDRLTVALNSGQELMPQELDFLLREGVIPRPGSDDELDELGGPDSNGYVFIDSQEEGGPAFTWIDITDTGTDVTGWQDDITQGPYDLPFSFNFYGTDYTQFYVCSNGWISFSANQGDEYNNAMIPSTGTPNNGIFWFWDDLFPTGSDHMYYEEVEDGHFVIQFGNDDYIWDEMLYAQVHLYDTGHIIISYDESSTQGITGETIGIENSDGTVGLQVSYNTTPDSYPVFGTSIEIYTLELDASVNGYVLDSVSEDPVEGATVYYGASSTTTDETGYYEFDPIYSWYYEVSIQATGFYPYTSEEYVTVSTGENVHNYTIEAFPEETLSYDFEDDSGDWSLDPTSTVSDWEWGAPTSSYFTSTPHSGNNVWGTNLDAGFSYGYDSFSMLVSNFFFDVAEGGGVFTFWAWDDHYFYSYYGYFYGGFNVQASTDGETWTTVTTVEPAYDNNSPRTNDEDTWATLDGPWKQYIVDMSDYAGQSVKVRFRHIYDYSSSSYATSYFGTAIDDIVMYGMSPPPPANLAGVVTDTDSGEPVSGADIVVGGYSTTTDETGAYSFTDIASGENLLAASADEYFGYQAALDLAGGDNTYDFTMDPWPTLTFSDDFESGPGYWQIDESSTTYDWEWGTPTSYMFTTTPHSGDNVWATDLDGGFTYQYDAYTMLTSNRPYYIDDPAALMTFWAWDDHYNGYYGGFQVRVSLDGANWTQVDIDPAYNANNSYTNYEDVRSTDNGPWTQYTVDLSGYYDNLVYIQFRHVYDYYYSYYATSWFGTAIDDINMYGFEEFGWIEGSVTNQTTSDPVGNFTVDLILNDQVVGTSDFTDGYYEFEGLPASTRVGTYTLQFNSPGYVTDQQVTGVVVTAGAGTTQDFIMEPNPPVDFSVFVYDSNDPPEPVEGATVTIQMINETATTDANGEAVFSQISEYDYTIHVVPEHTPNDLPVLHDEMFGITVVTGMEDEQVYLPMVLAPSDAVVNGANDHFEIWVSPPLNHMPAEVFAARIERLERTVAFLQQQGISGPKLDEQVAELAQARQAYDNLIEADDVSELDALGDFVGYRYSVNGVVQPDQIMAAGFDADTYFEYWNVVQGREYTFEFAADYGYGDDFLIFSEFGEGGRVYAATNFVYDDGVAFEWIEINPDAAAPDYMGTEITAWTGGTDDGRAEVLFTDFSFNYYGSAYTNVWVNTNGWVAFGDDPGTNAYSNVDFPNSNIPNNIIAPWWDDLHANYGDGIFYYEDNDNNRFIVQFSHAFSNGDGYNCQAVLNGDGTIQYNYLDSDFEWGNSPSVGMEDADGLVGVNYPYMNVYNGLSVLFTYSGPIGDWGAIDGYVYDEQTLEPVYGVEVAATDDFGNSFNFMTDEEGHYTIAAGQGGSPYEMVFVHPSYITGVVSNLSFEEGVEQLDVDDFFMDPLGTIYGTVTDGIFGDPIVGATVAVSNDELNDVIEVTTDENGEYIFERMLDRNVSYDLSFTANGYYQGQTFNVSFGVDDYSLTQNKGLTPFGTLNGTVTDGENTPLNDVMVVGWSEDDPDPEHSRVALTDENGQYSFTRLLPRTGSFSVRALGNGYVAQTVEGLTFGPTEYIITQDFSLTGVDNSTAPGIGSVDEKYDTGFDLYLLEPGYHGTVTDYYYTSGTVSDAYVIGAVDNETMMTVGFTPESGYVLETYVGFTNEMIWDTWPDGVRDDVVIILARDDGDGSPDMDNPLWISEPVTNAEDQPWVIVEPGIPVPDEGLWVCFYQYGPGESAILLDEMLDYPDAVQFSWDGGQTWESGDWMWGDPYMQISVFHPIDEVAVSMADGLIDPTPSHHPVTEHPVGQLRGHDTYFGISAGKTIARPTMRPGLVNDVLVSNGVMTQDELDEFQGFNVWYSTDGVQFTQSNENPVEGDPYFVEVGSEYENQDIWYYAEAINDGEASNASTTETVQFNMAPDVVADFVGQYADGMVTLDWTDPVLNSDGSPLTDLTGVYVYRNNTMIADLAPGTETYMDEIPVDFAGAAIYWVKAYDEVGNESGVAAFYNAGVFGTPDYELGFEAEAFDIFDAPYGPWDPDVWQKAAPTAGPEGAYEGTQCWSTYPDGYYEDNYYTYLVSEPMAILNAYAAFNYWHWFSYEGSWDGYNVQITTDNGESWEIIEPVESYSIASLISYGEPAFNGASDGWEMVNFSLGEYYTEDEPTFVQIALVHMTDGSAHSYYGAYVDDMSLYGLGPVSDYPFAPLPFSMQEPDDGQTVWTNSPTVSWERSDDYNPADQGNLTYNLEWSYNSDFSESSVITGIWSTWYTFENEVVLNAPRGNSPSDDLGEGVGMFRAGSNRNDSSQPGAGGGELDELDELDEILNEDAWVYWRVQAEDTGGLTTNADGYETGMSFFVNGVMDHFTPVDATENVFNVRIDAATIDAMPLQEGDEIAVFDGSVCVGGVVVQSNNDFPLIFNAYGDDGINPGFIEGNDIWFKIYSVDFGEMFWGLPEYIDGDQAFAIDGSTELVLSAMRNVDQTIDLTPYYWNLVSFPVDPVDGSTATMFGGISSLQTVVQANGNTYIPSVIDEISSVTHSKGYRVFCTEAEQLAYTGMTLDHEGVEYGLTQNQWNWMGYPFDFNLDVTVALADIAENLEIVRDDNGGFWIPSLNINTMGNMEPGLGYETWTDATVFFEYGGGGHSQILANPEDVWVVRTPADAPTGTGYPWTLLVDLDDELLQAGASQIAVYDGGNLVGKSYVMEDKPVSVITAWRGFPDLNLAGYTPGHRVTFKVYNEAGQELHTKMTEQVIVFEDNPYGTMSLAHNPLPTTFELSEGFPNPFNPAVKLKIALPNAGKVGLKVFNILGQEVYRSVQNYQAGFHYLYFDATRSGTELTSGVYFLQVQYEGHINVRKVVLLK